MNRHFIGAAVGLFLILAPASVFVHAQERARRPSDNTEKSEKASGQVGDKVAPGKEETILRLDGKLTTADPRDQKRKGSYCQVHKVKLEAGKFYQIELESDDFDAFLRLEDGAGMKLAEDDDGGGGTNSRIVFTPTKADSYSIIATSFEPGPTGKFTLSLKVLDELAAARLQVEARANQLFVGGLRQYERGQLEKALTLCEQALALRQKLFNKEQFPHGHPDLAESLSSVGLLLKAQGNYEKAKPYYDQALAMNQGLYPKSRYPQGHPDLASRLNNLGRFHAEQGDYSKAEPYFQQALAMYQKIYPKDRYPQGHSDLAICLDNLGSLLRGQGEFAKAEQYSRQALALNQGLYPKNRYPRGDPDLASSLSNLGSLLQAQGEYAKAEPYFLQALAMYRELYPKGHPHLATSLNNMGSLLQAEGEYTRAEPYLRQALAMEERLYPKGRYPHGHPDLATSLNNLGGLLDCQGEFAKAEPYFRRALAMRQALFPKVRYPQGNPDVASSLSNLGAVLQAQEKYDEAEPYLRQALAMDKQLYSEETYPLGHPELAASLNNLGSLFVDRGEYAKAEVYYRQALAIHQELFPKPAYPHGQSNFAGTLDSLGLLLQAKMEYGKAEEPQTLAALMAQQLVARYADVTSEAEALSYQAKEGERTLQDFLSLVRRRDHKAADYDLVWSFRSLSTRVVERRHQDVLAAKEDTARKLSSELTQKRQRLAQLLFKAAVKNADSHRKEIEDLTDKKEKLEKELALALKLEPRAVKAAEITPSRLQKALEAGTAFIDIVHYFDFAQDPKIPGRRGAKHTPRYLAYIVTRRELVRVDLKEAAPIEKAWSEWREAIVNNGRGERETASKFADLVWVPLAQQLPSDIKTIYLAPDGLLTQVPWAALPGSKPASVLLEELTIATVPHGPYLLQRLVAPAGPSERGGILVVGGVDYEESPISVAVLAESQRGPLAGKVVWPPLPGTKKELKQVAELASMVKVKATARSAIQASTDQVLADLGEVRYAHLATHGFFADAKFRSALQVDPKLFDTLGHQNKAAGARSPLVLSGLVFAGANRQGEKAAPDRGILTAEAIVGQRLEGMDLAVLSACETGLGEFGGGEGVYGLARAFHVAGCKNVIASLWKVDDEPTAALMSLFYRNLWVEKKTPLESLRRAQLHLLRHPEQIPALASLRGLDFTVRDLPKVTLPPATGRTANTSQWAAFVLSGLGS